MKDLKLSKDTSKLHSLFGKKLYSNRYSFVAEICQNAVDSHRMSGQTRPVEVGFGTIEGSPAFYIKDWGLSFKDKEDFINKVCTLLESGKSYEKTNDESCPMGMHGIGTISVSAYSDTWHYKIITPSKAAFKATLKEVEGKGLQYEIKDLPPEETEEKSSLFWVPLNFSLSYVSESLIMLFIERLWYFKDIKFVFDPKMFVACKSLMTLNSDFLIYKGKNFQISTLSKSDTMHIVLDQYYYPIRWDKLKMTPIKLNIGITLSLADGIEADLTRENLVCDEKYVKIIKDKIDLVLNEIVEIHNKDADKEFSTIKEYVDYLRYDYMHLKIADKINISLSQDLASRFALQLRCRKIHGIKNNNSVNLWVTGVKDLVFERKKVLHKGIFRSNSYFFSSNSKKFYLDVDFPFNKSLSHHLKSLGETCAFFKIYKRSVFEWIQVIYKGKVQATRKAIKYSIIELKNLRDDIKLLTEMTINEEMTRVSSVEYSKIKVKRTVKIAKGGEYSLYLSQPSCRLDKFIIKRSVVEDSFFKEKPLIYFKENQINEYYVNSVAILFNKILSFAFLKDTQHKIMETNKPEGTYSMEDFKSDNPHLRKLCSIVTLSQLRASNPHLFLNVEYISSNISKKMGASITCVLTYLHLYDVSGINAASSGINKIIFDLITYAQENNLYDDKIHSEYLFIQSEVHKYDFLKCLPNLKIIGTTTECKKLVEEIIKVREIKV